MKIVVKKLLIVLVICVVFLTGTGVTYAMVPYQTYTYSFEGEPVESPHAYVPDSVYDGKSLGTTKLSEPSDIFIDKQNNVYIADTGNNRIICLDSQMNLVKVIEEFEHPYKNGEKDKFNAPSGIFVTEDGTLYIADTEKSRIVIMNKEGKGSAVLPQPESEVFPEGFVYKPTAVAVDKSGRIYVVAKSTNMGVIALSSTGKFDGFMGAQKVNANLSDIFWRLFMTDAQKNRTVKFVPTEYNNLSIDDAGFLFVTSSAIDQWSQYMATIGRSRGSEQAPVKKLNPTGVDILKRYGFFPPAGDVQVRFGNTPVFGPSSIIDVASTENGVYSILDGKRNKVFTYDDDGKLLYAFGGMGNQLGVFKSAVSIAYQGTNLLVLDRGVGKLTRFTRTAYGDSIAKAIQLHKKRQYEQAVTAWSDLLNQNSNFDLAYIGMGKSFMRQEKYSEAMQHFKKANDWEDYSKAFRQLRKQVIEKNILWIPISGIALILLCNLFLRYAKKVNRDGQGRAERRRLKDELLYTFHLIFHPFDGFWDLKHEKRGSVRSATILLVLTVLTFLFKKVATGYLFSYFQAGKFDLRTEIMGVLIPFFLWCLANWCLTTLMDGEGSFRDIFITTAYGLTPIILINIPVTILSNFMVYEEGSFMKFFVDLSYGWAIFLIFFGVMIIHNYSMLKNALTSAFSIVGIGVIMFVAILFMNLIQRMIGFFNNLGVEIMYRL